MKICYVTMQFPVPSETFASLEVNTLRQLGHDVSVLAMRPKHRDYDKLIGERKHEGIIIEHLSKKNLFSALRFAILNLFVILDLVFWVIIHNVKEPRHLIKSLALLPSAIYIYDKIQKHKPDVVHLFWGHYPSMVGFLVYKYHSDILLSTSLGAYDLEAFYSGAIWLAKRSKLMFTYAKSNLPELEKLGIPAEFIRIVYQSIDLSHGIEAHRSKFRLLDQPTFITAARLIADKGVDDVLTIFSKILEQYPQSKLSVMGDGPERSVLETVSKTLGIDHAVDFLGHIPQDELIKALSETPFFLLMSRYRGERLPNVVKEAMFQECVCITTNTNGIDELVTDGMDGFIVEQGDCDHVISLILDILKDPEQCKLISSSAKKKIIDNFDVQKNMRKYISLWESFL